MTAVVADASGTPVMGALVRFSSGLGTLSPVSVTTGTNGTARALLTAPSVSSSIVLAVNVTASATGYGGATSSAQVTVSAPPSVASSSLGPYLEWLLIAIVVVVGAVVTYLALRRRHRGKEAPPLSPYSGSMDPPSHPALGGSSYPPYQPPPQ